MIEPTPTSIVLDGFLVRKNLATNGRLFICLVVALCVALMVVTSQTHFANNAILAVFGLGAGILADRTPPGWRFVFFSQAATILPAFALFGTFIKVIL